MFEDTEGAPDAAPAPAAPASPAPAAPASATEDGGTRRNAWDAVSSGFAEEHARVEAEALPTTDAPPAAPSGESPEAGKESAEGDAPPKPDAPPGEPEAGSPRFVVVDADGKPSTLALPEGHVVRFKAGGREVAARSVEELVAMAQKGAILPRVESKLHREVSRQTRELEQARALLVEADKKFRELVEDDEKLRQYRAEARKLMKDPEARAKAEAEAEAARKAQEATAQSAAAQEEAVAEFWDLARSTFEGQLEAFPYLTTDDFPLVAQAYLADFTAHRTALAEALAESPEGQALRAARPQDFEAVVDEEAVKWLTDDSFRSTLERINRTYESRATRAGKRVTTDASRAAEAHNQRTAEKLKQAADRRSVRATGGAPAPVVVGERERPQGWEGHLASIADEFRALRAE